MKAEVPGANFGWAAALGIATAPFLRQARAQQAAPAPGSGCWLAVPILAAVRSASRFTTTAAGSPPLPPPEARAGPRAMIGMCARARSAGRCRGALPPRRGRFD